MASLRCCATEQWGQNRKRGRNASQSCCSSNTHQWVLHVEPLVNTKRLWVSAVPNLCSWFSLGARCSHTCSPSSAAAAMAFCCCFVVIIHAVVRVCVNLTGRVLLAAQDGHPAGFRHCSSGRSASACASSGPEHCAPGEKRRGKRTECMVFFWLAAELRDILFTQLTDSHAKRHSHPKLSTSIKYGWLAAAD